MSNVRPARFFLRGGGRNIDALLRVGLGQFDVELIFAKQLAARIGQRGDLHHGRAAGDAGRSRAGRIVLAILDERDSLRPRRRTTVLLDKSLSRDGWSLQPKKRFESKDKSFRSNASPFSFIVSQRSLPCGEVTSPVGSALADAVCVLARSSITSSRPPSVPAP